MKLSLNRHEFLDALAIVTSVAPSRTPKPILQCVLIDVHDDYVILSATDLEIGVRVSVSQVEVDETGSVLVLADKLNQIVRESIDEVLSLEVSKDVCHVRGHDSHFRIYVQDLKDFPPVPEIEGDGDLTLEADQLRELTDWTVFAAARENTRYAINGVLWDRKGDRLTLVATDGRRLSRVERAIDGGGKALTAIVPIKAMQLIGKVFASADTPISVRIESNQIAVKTARVLICSTLLEGHFPKYEDVIPGDSDKSVRFDKAELLSAVRRVALLTNEESKGVRMAFTKGKLTLSSRAPDQGEAEVSLPIEYQDVDIDIGFNPVFIADVLRVVPNDEVLFEFKEANRPGVFKIGENMLYVVMPVNLS